MSNLDKILRKAEKEHDVLKHPYVGTEHLMLALLSYDDSLTEKLKEYKLTYNRFKRKLKEVIGEGSNKSQYVLYTPMLRKVLSMVDNEDNINIKLFNAIIKTNEGIAIRIIETMNINISSINLCDYMKVDDISIIEREKEISEILQILMRKNKCNPLLIGDAGVGKSAIVEEIQRRLLNNKVPNTLKGYKIINVDMSSLIAGTKYRGDFESKINELLKESESNKSILFIDEIHTLVNAGGAEGAISAGDIIKPYLARGNIKCIGATTLKEYHKYFEIDEALNRRFKKIMINEPSITSTLNILNNVKKNYEKFHNINIDDNLINGIIDISSKYITNKKNPDKSIELLDSCCTNAKYFEQNKADINNLYNIFECLYGINLKDEFVKNILENKSIVIASNKYINDNFNNCYIINIDGNEYKNEEDLCKLLGYYNVNNKTYLLKSVIDIPIGIIKLTNINGNIILKEFINKLINTRKIIDNFGNFLDFNNYIIVLDNLNNNYNSIGFKDNIIENINDKYIIIDENYLLSNV